MNGHGDAERGVKRAECLDAIPHGLPLRFSDLAVLTSSTGTDALVETLATGLHDVATAGPIRRTIERALGAITPRRVLIRGVEGCVQQGESLLVIGPPSSNTSCLLRALAMSSDTKLSFRSQIDYGLISRTMVTRRLTIPGTRNYGKLRSQVVYLSDHDVHFAPLSLQDTLIADAKARAPRNREPRISRGDWAKRQLQGIVDSLGLGHALGTAVGSSSYRGLSGGERKRASIAEALLTRAAVLLLDGPTNGLDSSTALSLLSNLRKWTKDGQRTLVVTTPHISDPLYAFFDKVLVLSATGSQVYFGKTSEAQKYFESLGLGFTRGVKAAEGTAEFIVGCVEDRELVTELENAWLASSARQDLHAEIAAYDKRYPWQQCAKPLLEALDEEKTALTPKSSHYVTSWIYQAQVLIARQFALIRAELPALYTKSAVNLAVSVLVGTLFFNLPQTTAGAFTRTSLLLLSIMFNAYLSLAELGKTIEGREIVKRQSDYGFFSSSALAVARVIGDLPLIGVQVLFFGTVTYLLAGLQRSLEKFCIYIVFVYATALNLSSLFRMFAAFSPTFDEAIRFCGITLNVLVIYAGYFIPTPTIQPWLRWVHFVIDPISYSYEAVLTNEFHNLPLRCSEKDVAPFGPSYTDPRYQTCLLPGSKAGNLTVLGDDYLSTSFAFHHDHIWHNLGIMAAQAFVFLVIGITATEVFHFAPQGSKRIWARTRMTVRRFKRNVQRSADGDSTGSLEEYFLDNVGKTPTASFEETASDETIKGSTLLWRDMSLWVDTATDTRRLLDRISGCIEPGKTCALMGASGAGKTTLLNVLAGRSGGVVRGQILVDGKKPTSDFYRTTGFVEQFDMHDDRATVREALEFSALLRQDANKSREEKLGYVDTVMDLLDLTHLQDAIIGTPSAGLNAEQRKRLTIAVEVVSRPAILFCDEPTTGLDTKSALRVVKLLRRLARTGLAVIATIHQPSAEAFAIFDDLLLLQRGGKQVYFGEREGAVGFFNGTGDLKEGENPADYLLDATGAGIEEATDEEIIRMPDTNKLSDNWKQSPRSKELTQKLSELATKQYEGYSPSIAPSISEQIRHLTIRVSRNYYRDMSFAYTKVFTSTIIPLIIGLSFLQQGDSIVSLQNRLFSIFLILFIPPVLMNLGIFKMFRLRTIWHVRERPSRIYGSTAFATSLVLSEIPYSLACATVYFALWYPLVGFPGRPGAVVYAFAMVQLFFFFQATWAMWILALAPSLGTVANLLPFFLVALECFNGSLMPYDQMPKVWRGLYWISPFQWYVRGMIGVLVHDQPVRCSPSEVVQFLAPAGQTCASYASEYLKTHAGYLLNPTAVEAACDFCRMSVGDDYLATLNVSYDDRGLSIGMMTFYTITNVIIFYALTYYPPSWPQWLHLSNILGGGKQGSNQRVTATQAAEEEYLREVQDEAQRLATDQPHGTLP